MHAVRQEIVELPLFAVGNDWRARSFEPFDGVSNRVVIERSEGRILAIDGCESSDEIIRSRDTANGLRRYGDRCRVGVGHLWACVSLGRATSPNRSSRPPESRNTDVGFRHGRLLFRQAWHER